MIYISWSCILICKGKNDKKSSSKPTQPPKPGSSSTNPASVSTSSTNSSAATTVAKTNQDYHELDGNSRNHAPPQYSDAVRLPNINQTSQSTSSQITANSTTEQTGIL